MLTKFKPIEIIFAALLLCVAAYFAYKNYFIQDDAYISFVYSKNFAHGHGLVWYPGSDEYGYTNFLYTLVIGILMFLIPNVDPEYFSATINFSSYIAALTLTYLLAVRLSGSKLAGACAVLVLATHHTFSAYASGGLETMPATALIIGFYYVLFQPPTTNQQSPYLLAALASAALLTRLDSALLLFPGYVYLLCCLSHMRQRGGVRAIMLNKNLWLAAGIPTLYVLALLGWAYSYYGYALPNTFYAKIPGDQSMTWLGKRYLRKYLELHHYIPAYLLGLALVMLLCKLSVLWAARWVTRENSQSQSAIPNAQSLAYAEIVRPSMTGGVDEGNSVTFEPCGFVGDVL